MTPTTLLYTTCLLLCLCTAVFAAGPVSNLIISSVNGAAPVVAPTTTQYLVPAQATVVLSWEYDASATTTEASSGLFYVDQNLSYDFVIANIDFTAESFSFQLPLRGHRDSAQIILRLSNDNHVEVSSASTETFITQSLCETTPDYCGAGNACDDATELCTCNDADFSGARCNISKCDAAGCVAANTDSCTVSTDSFQCLCKEGFEGARCQYATKCLSTKSCANDGFVGYTTASITCNDKCTCLNQYHDKADLAAGDSGCTECSISCANNGVYQKGQCRCNCQPGFTGSECKGHYALGKLSFSDVDKTFSNSVAVDRFVASLTPLVRSIMQIETAEISEFGTFVDGSDFNVVYMFKYSSSQPTNNQLPTAPRGTVIRAGWKAVQAEVGQVNSLLQTFFTAMTKTIDDAGFTTLAEGSAVLPPDDLYDPSCGVLFDDPDAHCPSGDWPMNYPEPVDKTNDSAIKWWVFGLAIGCIGVTIILLFTFFVVGNDAKLTAARMESDSKARAAGREERLKLLIDREERRENMRLEAKDLRQRRHLDGDTVATAPTDVQE